jgi:hypothetical protein
MRSIGILKNGGLKAAYAIRATKIGCLTIESATDGGRGVHAPR